jgi:hypothetical protein
MAAVAAANGTAYGFTTPAGPKTATTESGGPGHLENCYVACSFTGTYVQGTGFTISNAFLTAAIASVKRDGGTIVIADVASAAPGLETVSGVSTFTAAGPVTYAAIGNAATGLLYGSDLATERGAGAMNSYATPIVFFVSFSSLQPNV